MANLVTIDDLIDNLPRKSQEKLNSLSKENYNLVIADLHSIVKTQNERLKLKEHADSHNKHYPVTKLQLKSLKNIQPLMTNNVFSKNSGYLEQDLLRLEITTNREGFYVGLLFVSFLIIVFAFGFESTAMGVAGLLSFFFFLRKSIITDDFLVLNLKTQKVYECLSSSGNYKLNEILDLDIIHSLAVEAERVQTKDSVYFKHRVVAVTNNLDKVPLSDFYNKNFLDAIGYARVLSETIKKPYFHANLDSQALVLYQNKDFSPAISFV